jgi:multisubunit Na+/H+ antiporter MnhG subunit
MATVSTIAAGCVLAAVVIEEGWGQATIKASLVVVVMLIMNAVLTHATARAALIRTHGTWMPDASGKPESPTQGRGEGESEHERKKNET